jgi:hypothetical protein
MRARKARFVELTAGISAVGNVSVALAACGPTCATNVKNDSKESGVGRHRKLLSPTRVDYGLPRSTTQSKARIA